MPKASPELLKRLSELQVERFEVDREFSRLFGEASALRKVPGKEAELAAKEAEETTTFLRLEAINSEIKDIQSKLAGVITPASKKLRAERSKLESKIDRLNDAIEADEDAGRDTTKLESELDSLQARLDEVDEMIDRLEYPAKAGRPIKEYRFPDGSVYFTTNLEEAQRLHDEDIAQRRII